MALNSPKSNNFSTILSLRCPKETFFNCSGKRVNRVGQLGLNKSVTKLRKTSLTAKGSSWVQGRVNATEEIVSAQFSCPSSTSLNDVHDTESILRASQILRAQLVHAASSPVSNKVVVPDTEEKKKARDLLQAQLLRASALAPHKNEVVSGSGTSKPTSFDIMTAHLAVAATSRSPHRLTLKPQFETHRFLNSDVVDKSIVLCPTPLTTYYGNDTNNVGGAIKVVENVSGNEKDNKYDGRTHSYPYKKNGPYTCPKCKHVSETSQKFAAHVSSSHYKYESKSERKKRVMAKVRGRTKNLGLERVKEGLTIVPHDFVATNDAGNNNSNVAPRPPVMIKIESVEVGEGVRGVKYALAPPPGMELIPGAGVKIKLERVDKSFQ